MFLQGAKKREKCTFRFEKLYISFLRLYLPAANRDGLENVA